MRTYKYQALYSVFGKLKLSESPFPELDGGYTCEFVGDNSSSVTLGVCVFLYVMFQIL